MFKLMIAIALVASASAHSCQSCKTAADLAGKGYCAYEESSSCGCKAESLCNSEAVNGFRITDCGLNRCGDKRRLTETTDLEEQTHLPQSALRPEWNWKDMSVLPGTLIPRRLAPEYFGANLNQRVWTPRERTMCRGAGAAYACPNQMETCASSQCKNQLFQPAFVCCHNHCKCKHMFCKCAFPNSRGWGKYDYDMSTYRTCKCMGGWPSFGFSCFQGKDLAGRNVKRGVTVCAARAGPPPTPKPALFAQPASRPACTCNKATHTCSWGCRRYNGKCIMWVSPFNIGTWTCTKKAVAATPYPTAYPTRGYVAVTRRRRRSTPYPTAYPTRPYVAVTRRRRRSTPYPTAYPTRPRVVATPYPTAYPTGRPTARPTNFPTAHPTPRPTNRPTTFPTAHPTSFPTASPTLATCTNVFCTYSWIDNRDGHDGRTGTMCKKQDRSIADGGTGVVTRSWCHRQTTIFTDNKPGAHWHCKATADLKGLDSKGQECDPRTMSDQKLLLGAKRKSCGCACKCGVALKCTIVHHHQTGYTKKFNHC